MTNKVDQLISKSFPSVSSKEWKQKIQYELKGKDYQSVVKTTSEGISSLPFYHEDLSSNPYQINIQTPSKASFYLIVQNENEANTKLIHALEMGFKNVHLAVFKTSTNLNVLLENITCNITLQCYFIDTAFLEKKELKSKNCTVLWDVLGKVSKTGNWFKNVKSDFVELKKCLSHSSSKLFINSSIFQNAGAGEVQQLSYSIAKFMEYHNHKLIDANTKIVYGVSTGTSFYIEIAKLISLRYLHKKFAKKFNFSAECELIQFKSKRNLSALSYDLNISTHYLECEIGALGFVNNTFSFPELFLFYKEDQNTVTQIQTKILKQLNAKKLNLSSNLYIDKLITQLTEKSTDLISSIEKGGGYINQLKKGIIQNKIKVQAKANSTQITKIETLIEDQNIQNKTTVLYPFLKHKTRKTLWQPIVEVSEREVIEKPIWESYFNSK